MKKMKTTTTTTTDFFQTHTHTHKQIEAFLVLHVSHNTETFLFVSGMQKGRENKIDKTR